MLKIDNFEIIYNRILSVTNCTTQMELAALLEISQSLISDAKRRASIPDTWLIILFDKLRLNPDYLRYGTGVMYINKRRKTHKHSIRCQIQLMQGFSK